MMTQKGQGDFRTSLGSQRKEFRKPQTPRRLERNPTRRIGHEGEVSFRYAF
jgi:hypothetical protein